MNVSPEWKPAMERAGHVCVHWSEVGDPRADDVEIMEWARERRHIVFTHDLDFGTILFHTKASGPSVVQLRGKDFSPIAMADDTIKALEISRGDLESGALLTIESDKHRLRILPFT